MGETPKSRCVPVVIDPRAMIDHQRRLVPSWPCAVLTPSADLTLVPFPASTDERRPSESTVGSGLLGLLRTIAARHGVLMSDLFMHREEWPAGVQEPKDANPVTSHKAGGQQPSGPIDRSSHSCEE